MITTALPETITWHGDEYEAPSEEAIDSGRMTVSAKHLTVTSSNRITRTVGSLF